MPSPDFVPKPILSISRTFIIIIYEILARGKAPGEIWGRCKRRQQTEIYRNFSLVPSKLFEAILSLFSALYSSTQHSAAPSPIFMRILPLGNRLDKFETATKEGSKLNYLEVSVWCLQTDRVRLIIIRSHFSRYVYLRKN